LEKDVDAVRAADLFAAAMLGDWDLGPEYDKAQLNYDEQRFGTIQAIINARNNAVKQAAGKAALSGQIILGGLSIVNEGSDWVMTIDDLSQGNYVAAAAFLPFISNGMVRGGKLLVKHGDEVLDVTHLAGTTDGQRAIAEILDTGQASGGAHSAADAVRLNKSLAGQQQMGEAGARMAGQGTGKVFRDAGRVAQEYGGNPQDWVKVTSSSHVAPDGVQFETHWVENIRTGQRVEWKTKIIGGQ